MANNNWNNYTEKTATPVDADEVMVRDSTDGKNKKLLFGTFWKWVAKKLNEATISELQTSNKTIVGALNQLNSESFNNGYNLNLTDWNSISAPGIYSGNGSDAKNSPSYSEGIWINAIAFASNGNKNYITIIAFYGLHISVKTKANETWSGWELLV